MLKLVRELFERMNTEGVCYCHWKSNVYLQEALDALADLDLLIHPGSVDRFESIVSALRFKRAAKPPWQTHPSILHYFGLDFESGVIVHLHVYFKLVTGGRLVKSCCLPLEGMLFENGCEIDQVRVPSRPAELLLFVVRKMLEYASPPEWPFTFGESRRSRRELEWLVEGDSISRAHELRERWFATLDADAFDSALGALRRKGALGSRLVCGRRVRRRLRAYLQDSPLSQDCVRAQRLVRWIILRILRRPPRPVLPRGGTVIAIVGPEASGKSTLRQELHRWLAEYFSVATITPGTPPSTVWTFLPDLLLPLLRRLLPRYRPSRVVAASEHAARERVGRLGLLTFGLRSVMVAFSRERLISRGFRWSSNGTFVLSDRYPTTEVGAVDSARLDAKRLSRQMSPLRWLARLENRIYRRIPPPEIILRLSVPLEVALERNAIRGTRHSKSDDYLRCRRVRVNATDFRTARIFELDTQQSLPGTILAAKQAIWESL